MSKSHNLNRAFVDYWANLIHEKQKEVRRGDLTCGTLEATLFNSTDLSEIESILNAFWNGQYIAVIRR